ncbi:MAG: hypothetical protein WKF45_01210 [Ilumatobacteraceae bacterium]
MDDDEIIELLTARLDVARKDVGRYESALTALGQRDDITIAAKPTAKREPPKRRSTQRLDVDLNEVAKVAVDAREAGMSMSAAIMDEFDVSTSSAVRLIERARKAGHTIPGRGQNATPRPVAAAPVPDRPAPWTPDRARQVLDGAGGDAA